MRWLGYKARLCSSAWKATSRSIDVSAKEASKLPDCGKRWLRSFWQMCGRDLDKEKNRYCSGLGRAQGKRHIRYAFVVGRQFLEYVPLQKSPRTDGAGLIKRRSGTWSQNRTSTNEPEERSDLSIVIKSERHRFLLKRKTRSWAIRKQGLVERRQVLQKQRRAMENIKCRRNGGPRLLRLLLGVRIGPGHQKPSTESKDGRQRR